MNLGWLRFTGWIAAWMALVLLPMAIALAGELPATRTRLKEAAALLGFVGLGLLAMQAVVSGRQRWFARGLGQDDLLQFHRRTGETAWLLVLVHPLAMFAADPSQLAWLDPREDLLRAGSLWLLLAAVSLLLATSLWRQQFGLSYERWRALHGVLAFGVVALALGHVLLVDHYTAQAWKKVALVVVVGSALWLTVETRLRRPWQRRRRPWTVVDVAPEPGAATTLRLRPDGHPGLAFVPGQFAWVTLGDSPWRMQQHPFSMTSPADQAEIWFTIKPAGDFTGGIASTRIGSRAWIEGPYGVFTWQPGFAPHGAVFVAGGVGITPFLSMLRTARARRGQDRLWLFYANSDADSIIAREELDVLARELPLRVVHVLDDPPDGWTGEAGHIDADMLERHLPAEVGTMLAYVCGPAPMADAVEPVLLERGIPAKNLYSERFDMV
ncbi:ferredoxin reductase family protein [Luteimonas sp. YGD11-2]|uniref:ferredoxin reductase family protein n=1 Tax=Luteimonas sp. YGD11-2 TaxID=2508168 RepID=UPI00100B3250|nr:ferredoxin reductase family protein [Luteimonas sp. YGD11-2]